MLISFLIEKYLIEKYEADNVLSAFINWGLLKYVYSWC